MEIQARIDEISEEYAQLPQIGEFDITFDAIDDSGAIQVTLLCVQSHKSKIERLILPEEPLGFISDTLNYHDTLHARSKDIVLDGMKYVYFDGFGRLVLERGDSTVEVFKVKEAYREELSEKLKEQFGNKFSETGRPQEKQVRVDNRAPRELLYKINYIIDGKPDHFITAGDTIDAVRATALDIISERGLDFEKNKINSQSINS